jgi:RNA polymerase sigma-B factor
MIDCVIARSDCRASSMVLASERMPADRSYAVAKSRLDDRRLQRRHLRGDRTALAELVARHLPLARHLALRYRFGGEPVDDLIQVASIGLLNALRRWDPERGTAVSSLAVPTITGELRRYLRDSAWGVRPPRAVQELALVATRRREQMWNENERPATVGELADALGRSHQDVVDALRAAAARRSESLDVPRIAAVAESTPAVGSGGVDDGYDRVEDAVTADSLTAILDERAREVVRLRFAEDLLQRDIAERVGCSQMHVSRILRDAIAKMRLQVRLNEQRAA